MIQTEGKKIFKSREWYYIVFMYIQL